MELPFLGYPLAAVMGLLLGLLGAGGSIITVPLLVYTLAVPPLQATAYSLLIVGITAAMGAWQYHRKKGFLDLRIGLIFAIPSLLGVLVARTFIVPFIPETLIDFGPIMFTRDNVLLLLFAFLMLCAGWMMIKPFTPHKPITIGRFNFINTTHSTPMFILEGLGVGLITGMVGAGGRFIIVPVLVLMAKLPMKQAVATSLFIIAIKSCFGFFGDVMVGTHIHYGVLFGVTAATLIGMLASQNIHHKIPETILKKGFAIFIFMAGSIILVQQIADIFYFGAQGPTVQIIDILPPPTL